MSELIDTTEMYLKVVFELEEQRQPALRARLSERLEQAMPSVSQTVSRMERDGLLTLDDQRVIRLTETGRSLAVAVMRKHRIAERFLFDVLELDWADVHEEACRWEHVLGDAAEAKLAGMLKVLDTDPYGNPIPGLNLIGREPAKDLISGSSIVEEVDGQIGTLSAIGEGIQAVPGILRTMSDSGIIPGGKIRVVRDGPEFRISGTSGEIVLSHQLAAQLFINQ